MKPPKEGSRKRQVWDVLQRSGPLRAISHADTLELAPGTVRSWLSAWGHKQPSSARPKVERVPLEPKGLARPTLIKLVVCKSKPGHGGPLKERGRCYDIGNKNKIGTILVLGPHQSEVKWPDGAKQIINNDKLRNAKREAP